MSTAHEIMAISRNSDDALLQSELLTSNILQDWENERTIFTFDDDSVLVVQNANVFTFDSIDAFKKV